MTDATLRARAISDLILSCMEFPGLGFSLEECEAMQARLNVEHGGRDNTGDDTGETGEPGEERANDAD